MYRLHTLDTDNDGLLATEIPLAPGAPEHTVRLSALPGASAIHFAISDDGDVRWRGEIPADEPTPGSDSV